MKYKTLMLVTNHFLDWNAIYYRGHLIWEGEENIRLYKLVQSYPEVTLGDMDLVVLTENCTHLMESDGGYPDFIEGLEFDEQEQFTM